MLNDYPSLIVDNFFKDPLRVREFALTLDYTPCKEGTFSGIRTESLHITHPNFFRRVCKKILSCYSLSYKDYSATMHFHLTGEEVGDTGWVHIDGGCAEGSKLASIIYLNPSDSGIKNGTSLYKLTNLDRNPNTHKTMREAFITSKDNEENRNIHNSNYEPNIIIGNNFNRMIAYDTNTPHAGSGYYGNNAETSRLTLLTFFYNILTDDNLTPNQRSEVYSDL
jgi:hypothetical protein